MVSKVIKIAIAQAYHKLNWSFLLNYIPNRPLASTDAERMSKKARETLIWQPTRGGAYRIPPLKTSPTIGSFKNRFHFINM